MEDERDLELGKKFKTETGNITITAKSNGGAYRGVLNGERVKIYTHRKNPKVSGVHGQDVLELYFSERSVLFKEFEVLFLSKC